MTLVWRKSSFSSPEGDCLELAWPITGAAVRDSKNTAAPILLLPTEAVTALIGTIKRG